MVALGRIKGALISLCIPLVISGWGVGLVTAMEASAASRPAPASPVAEVTERTPLFIPSPPFEATAPCGGDLLLASLSYYPKPTEGTFTAKFRGMGGPAGGYVVLEVGDAYGGSVAIPAESGQAFYTITVTVPPPVIWAPIIVYAGGPACGPSVDGSGGGGAASGSKEASPAYSVGVEGLNIFASP